MLADLQALIDDVRAEAQQRAQRLGLASAYEALVDAQTPGLRLHHIRAWQHSLLDVCGPAVQSRARHPVMQIKQPDIEPMPLLHSTLGVLDIGGERVKTGFAPHPICLGTHDNVGLAVPRTTDNPAFSMLDTMHEAGHALYRLNLPTRPDGGIALDDLYAGAGTDEAMAMIVEHFIGRNPSFIKRVSGLDDEGAEALQAVLHAPERNGLRIQADEVRYPLDVILRIRMEQALFDDGLAVADLPGLWRREFAALTGIEVMDDRHGFLQDIHWFGGEFGRFPAYLFGYLAAAQLMRAACAKAPAIPAALEQGDARPLLRWLSDNIYSKGAQSQALDLIHSASGAPLSPAAYISHIRSRYRLSL